jgi:hypothetical protein
MGLLLDGEHADIFVNSKLEILLCGYGYRLKPKKERYFHLIPISI